MGVRFRKQIKLGPGVRVNLSKSGVSASVGPRGTSATIGKNGAYGNVGIPGTGLSYRTKLNTNGSSGATGYSQNGTEKVSAAEREWQEYTGTSTPKMHLNVDDLGNITFADDNGPITDETLISIIKRTPQYKSVLPELKAMQNDKAGSVVENLARQNDLFIKTYTHSPEVLNRQFYEQQYTDLKPVTYRPSVFPNPQPTPMDIQSQLSREAEAAVKGAPWSKKKLIEKYCAERYQSRFNEAFSQWNAEKEKFDRLEAAQTEELNKQCQMEYEQAKASFEKSLEGDTDYIEDAAEQWVSSCELPVDISTQFEYRAEQKCLMVDLDLPEIEDLPSETAVQSASGSVKVKDKSQKSLKTEYAECVFGLAIFVAANLFNVSPCIENVTISGYTQRRDKEGNITDDYILSVKFSREGFYGVDYKNMVPEDFCMTFENRCNLSATKIFKSIKPYE